MALAAAADVITLAHAHGSGIEAADHAHNVWAAWSFDPLVLLLMALAAYLYVRGARQVWGRGGRAGLVAQREARLFAAGMTALALALIWPLDDLGERLFSAHMAQHLVLMNLAAPLLVLASPVPAMLRALPRAWQRALGAAVQSHAWRSTWRCATGVWVATVLQQAVLWTWHTPSAMAVALHDDAIHALMHASLLASALLFWTAVFQARQRYQWQAISALVVTLKVSGVVSIVLLLEPNAIYTVYGDSAEMWGFSAATDEHIGWGLMMLVGTASYLFAAIALIVLSFNRLERSQPALRPAPHEMPSVQ